VDQGVVGLWLHRNGKSLDRSGLATLAERNHESSRHHQGIHVI